MINTLIVLYTTVSPSLVLTNNLKTPHSFDCLSIISFFFFCYCIHTGDHSDTIALHGHHFLGLVVPHYDCFHQSNLWQFSLTHVQRCSQAPPSLQYIDASATAYVRAEAKRPKAWTCEAYFEKERFWCAQSDYRYRRKYDLNEYHNITMERPFALNPKECKNAIR